MGGDEVVDKVVGGSGSFIWGADEDVVHFGINKEFVVLLTDTNRRRKRDSNNHN